LREHVHEHLQPFAVRLSGDVPGLRGLHGELLQGESEHAALRGLILVSKRRFDLATFFPRRGELSRSSSRTTAVAWPRTRSALAHAVHGSDAMKTVFSLFAIALLASACGGSKEPAEGPAENAGEKADEAGEKVEEKAEEAGDKMENAADKAEDKVDKAEVDKDKD
jgi:hypothetical protein